MRRQRQRDRFCRGGNRRARHRRHRFPNYLAIELARNGLGAIKIERQVFDLQALERNSPGRLDADSQTGFSTHVGCCSIARNGSSRSKVFDLADADRIEPHFVACAEGNFGLAVFGGDGDQRRAARNDVAFGERWIVILGLKSGDTD